MWAAKIWREISWVILCELKFYPFAIVNHITVLTPRANTVNQSYRRLQRKNITFCFCWKPYYSSRIVSVKWHHSLSDVEVCLQLCKTCEHSTQSYHYITLRKLNLWMTKCYITCHKFKSTVCSVCCYPGRCNLGQWYGSLWGCKSNLWMIIHNLIHFSFAAFSGTLCSVPNMQLRRCLGYN